MDAAVNRKITDADRAAAKNLRRVYLAYKRRFPYVTQETVANDLSMTQGAFSHYMTGRVAMGPQAVLRFADYFGVDPTAIRPDFKYGKKVHISHRIEPPSRCAGLSLESIGLARKWAKLPKRAQDCVTDIVDLMHRGIRQRKALQKRKNTAQR